MEYNSNTDDFHTVFRQLLLRMYLDKFLPILRKKREVMIEHRFLNKKRLILEFKFLDRKRYAKQILQERMNTHCVDNIMKYI